ncbi:unnamed protein product [Arabis nemorensis]|uniref:Uncharacterized protein n=1 Tax=Arabis nemorensis TaxID=586526 RepID=A0A565BP22_9BRAS|nr:unnamed protein product [Arabis nemorensis]
MEVPDDDDLNHILFASRFRKLTLAEIEHIFYASIHLHFPITAGANIPVNTPGVYRVDTANFEDLNNWEHFHGGPYGSNRVTSSFIRRPGGQGGHIESADPGLITLRGTLAILQRADGMWW